jgi:hypothetical protein
VKWTQPSEAALLGIESQMNPNNAAGQHPDIPKRLEAETAKACQ